MERQVFTAKTMAQALVAMKAALGHEAVLISRQKVKRGGLFGIGAEELYEVVGEKLPEWMKAAKPREESPVVRRSDRGERRASVDRVKESIIASARGVRQQRSPSAQGWIAGDDTSEMITKSFGTYGRTPARPRLQDKPQDFSGLHELQKEFRELKVQLQALSRPKGPPHNEIRPLSATTAALQTLRASLISCGMPPEFSDEIIASVAGRSTESESNEIAILRARVAKEVASRVKVARLPEISADAPTIIVVIGATGVGKTTTLAKLGSLFHEGEARSIAYLTLDNYRIAAVEQLRTYSEIQEAPFEEITSAEELSDAVDRHIDKDVILIDTPGRSPYHVEAIAELREMLSTLGPDVELLLLVSSTSDIAEMEAVIRSFSTVGDRDRIRLVFTKLDETVRIGAPIAAAAAAGLPITLWTTGQDVPDDLEPADGARLAEMILKAAPEEVARIGRL